MLKGFFVSETAEEYGGIEDTIVPLRYSRMIVLKP